MIKNKIGLLLIIAVMTILIFIPATALAEAQPVAEQPTAPEETVPVPEEPIEESPAEEIPSVEPHPDPVPTPTSVPEKLVVKLGAEWAGVAFKLVMDYGEYPGEIVVDENGILTTELGGSTLYTLTSLGSVAAPAETSQPVASESPSSQLQMQSALTDESDTAGKPTIPTWHIVLFVGGLTASIVTLVAMKIAKGHRLARYVDGDEDDEDDED